MKAVRINLEAKVKMEQSEILVKSSVDGTKQPSLFYKSPNSGRPLLVGLHTWSYDRFNQIDNMLPYAEAYDFNLLLPEFRGPNTTSNPNCTKACGSVEAKSDIRDAIDYVLANYDIDKENVFLLGASGGGHMALMMAGFCPEYFKAIGSFVPISDLERWKGESPRYADHVDACCGNEMEMLNRSPINYIDTIATANLKIFHGKYDHIVPAQQSIDFFNELNEKYPKSRVFLDIFDGGHEMDMEQAFYWINSQYNEESSEEVTG